MTPCPACGNIDRFEEFCAASFLGPEKRSILECPTCGLSFLWPLPTDEELGTYYCQGYFDFNRNREEGKGWWFARRLRRLAAKGRFLDVGCATGFFIHGIRQNCSWEVFGLETGKGAADYARRELGLDVKDTPLEQAAYPSDFFDYIHFNNVLEHVTDPNSILREIARILKPGGTLFISVPNGRVDRFGCREYLRRTHKPAASKDGHLFFYSPQSLGLLFEKAGLKLEKASSSGFKRSLRVLGYLPRKKGWEKPFEPRGEKKAEVGQVVVEGKRHSRLYYLFKHGKEEWFRLGGFSPLAYDFTLYLTKEKGAPSRDA